MSIIGWIMTVSGAAVGTALFEIVFNWLFGVKRTKLKKSQDPGYQSRIRLSEKLRYWL